MLQKKGWNQLQNYSGLLVFDIDNVYLVIGGIQFLVDVSTSVQDQIAQFIFGFGTDCPGNRDCDCDCVGFHGLAFNESMRERAISHQCKPIGEQEKSNGYGYVAHYCLE